MSSEAAKARLSDTEESFLHKSANGDLLFIYGFGLFVGEAAIGALVINSKRGKPVYRTRVFRDGVCTTHAELTTRTEAVEFLETESVGESLAHPFVRTERG